MFHIIFILLEENAARKSKTEDDKGDEEMLYNFMRSNPTLWDQRQSDYKNNAKKADKWKELSGILNRDGEYELHILTTAHSMEEIPLVRENMMSIYFVHLIQLHLAVRCGLMATKAPSRAL